ncbi:M28 family peptidase [Litoribaculum gwangyangense]|uniref:M28 family metallopeptidase n=1 Tax=Litoribaculum gwangyangense TaxID=1130722 RepID=A0ABP9C713_9FLAO
MNKLLNALLILILSFSCTVTKNKEVSKSSKISSDKAVEQVKSIIVPYTIENVKHIISKESIKTNLEYLASDELQGRETGSTGIEQAAVYIENFFKKYKVKPYFETYRDSFDLGHYVGYNVVGYLPGNDFKLKNEFVILGAHYDHIGIAANIINNDSIANGANDDASGTVAVLEWAKYFAKVKNNKRSILFTLYSAEEKGLKGSEHLAKKLKESNLDLYTMINFEMIGVPRADSETMSYVTGYDRSNIAKKLNTYAGKEIIGFLPQAKAYKLFERSDNYPFYNEFKIPAHAISTFDFTNFDYYHHVDDEVDKMNYDHMLTFITKMAAALEGMVNAPTKEIKMKNE